VNDKCSHGIPWTGACRACDKVWRKEMLKEAEARVAALKAAIKRFESEVKG